MNGPNDKSGSLLSSRESICPDVEPGICTSVPVPSVIEDDSPHSEVPTCSSHENNPRVSNLTTPLHFDNIDMSVGYTLPTRHNRGKPPNRYSPDFAERRLRHPIANYVSTKDFSRPLKTFPQELSLCKVPTSVQEVLENPRWTQAIEEEMKAILKNNRWALFPLPKGNKIVGCR